MRNAVGASNIDENGEQRVNQLLRQARQARREGNESKCRQQLTQAQTVLRQAGVQVALTTQQGG